MLLHLLLVSLHCLFSALLKTGLNIYFFCLTLPPLFTNKVTLCRTVSKRTEFSSYFSFPLLSFFPFSCTSLLTCSPSHFHCVCVTLWSLIALWSLLFFSFISWHSSLSFSPMFFSSQYESQSLSVLIQIKLEVWHSRITRNLCAKHVANTLNAHRHYFPQPQNFQMWAAAATCWERWDCLDCSCKQWWAPSG